MRNLVLRLFINAVALWGASEVVAGVELTEDFWGVLLVAAVFGLINALIKPIVTLLALPLLLLTLGLLTLLINAMMLMLTDLVTPYLTITGFLPALVGAVVVSAVSFLLSIVLRDRASVRRPAP